MAFERVDRPELSGRWGEIVRWQIDGASWTIELPGDGGWHSGDPLNEAEFSPDAVTYRSESNASGGSDPSLFVDVLRLDLGRLADPTCTIPTVLSPDGGLLSGSLGTIRVDDRDASLGRLTRPAADGSTTGTFQVCFITGGSMYQLTAAARPADAEADLLAMIRSFSTS